MCQFGRVLHQTLTVATCIRTKSSHQAAMQKLSYLRHPEVSARTWKTNSKSGQLTIGLEVLQVFGERLTALWLTKGDYDETVDRTKEKAWTQHSFEKPHFWSSVTTICALVLKRNSSHRVHTFGLQTCMLSPQRYEQFCFVYSSYRINKSPPVYHERTA